MRKHGAIEVRMQGDREIVVTRPFAAPRALVFDCMTKVELMRRWRCAPPRWTVTKLESDFRVGGRWRQEMRSDTGEFMGFGGVYREIERPARFVSTQAFDEAWYPGEAVDTATFEERDGRTLYTLTIRYDSPEARDHVASHPFAIGGMESGYVTLDEALVGLVGAG